MSSSVEKVRNKDITSFHRICKDLYKFIQKRIIRKYVNPNMKYEPVNSLGDIISRNKEWKYYNTQEKISEEEKILDIFKDNVFLSELKSYYESLEKIINILDENEHNVELLQKDIEVGEKKIEMLSKLNMQLNQLFNPKDNEQNNSNNNSNNSSKSKGNNNSNNVLDKIHLVKSLNILNELQFFNNNNNIGEKDKIIKNNNTTTSNTTITNNNNIIVDNKIINNNIRPVKSDISKERDKIEFKEELNKKDNSLNKQNNSNKNKNKNKNSQQNKQKNIQNSDINEIKLLNKKVKRENVPINKEEEFLDITASKSKDGLLIPNFVNNNNEAKNIINTNNSHEELSSPPRANNNIDNNNNINQNNNTNDNNKNNPSEKEQDNPKNSSLGNNDNPQSSEQKAENSEDQNSLEYEFEKVLKDKFAFMINAPHNKLPKFKKDIMTEINNILKKIPNLKYNRRDKFDDPYIVGSYAHFAVINLMDYIPPIDIMFKCKNIKSVKELKDIVDETMKKKMGFNYLELGNEYDKKNEIVKFYHKCKFNKGQKDNNSLFFFFNIIFVGINMSNFNQKETSINRFYFNNNGMYEGKGKILISLYFRRWRKKYNLSFMMPEFMDIIINYYYNDKNNLSFIIEEIFLALFNGNFNFLEKKEGEENDNINTSEDVENLKEIKKFIFEWYDNPEYKKKMTDAILDTQELIMNSKFYNTFNTDE